MADTKKPYTETRVETEDGWITTLDWGKKGKSTAVVHLGKEPSNVDAVLDSLGYRRIREEAAGHGG